MIQIKVPARICFFGDHQDYLGLPVIAGAVNRFITLTAQPIEKEEFQIDLEDLGMVRTISLKSDLTTISKDDYFCAAMILLMKKGMVFSQGFSIHISGNIPLNSGLSSSSALVVAWIRFLIAHQSNFRTVSDIEVGQWAYEVEVQFFNQPGGLMDQYSIAQRGLLYIDTKTGQTEELSADLGLLVVAESGIEKQTLGILKNARTFQEKAIAEVKKVNLDFNVLESRAYDYERYVNYVSEEFKGHWYAAICNYDITKKAKRLLASAKYDRKQLGRLMNEHQEILERHIENTPLKMVQMMRAALNAGAIGAKTIGSGGGGCMVAMVDENSKKEVIKAFLAHGAKDAYELKLVYP